MSYYPPPPAGTTYPYGTYGSTPNPYAPHGTYPYQPHYPATAVTGYGATAWPYPYSYFPSQQPARVAQRASTSTPVPYASTSATTNNAPAPAAAAPAAAAPQRVGLTSSTYTFASTPYARESGTGTGGAARSGRKQATYKGLFTKELRNLMYGFGDDRNPSNDTVNVLEEILVEYIMDICQTALAPGKKSRLSIEDIRRALSRPADAKKLARMEELLFMQEDIKRARAQFEESDMNQASSFQS